MLKDQASQGSVAFADRPHILVVDDDARLRDLLVRTLVKEGMVAVGAEHAMAARALMARLSFDLVVLDVMMPGETGVELTASLRAAGNAMPILLLTAMGAAPDRIGGLRAGADDYLVKPFEPQELILRIGAILRRRPTAPMVVARFTLGPWAIDLAREEIALSPMGPGVKPEDLAVEKLTIVERNLLKALVARPGVPQRREDLASACGVNPDERTIDVQITRLRRRLGDDPKNPRYIATIRGQGYQLLTDQFVVVG